LGRERTLLAGLLLAGTALLAVRALAARPEEEVVPPPEGAPPTVPPPPGIPVSIRSLGPATVQTNVGAWVEGIPCWDLVVRVRYCGRDWERDRVSYVEMGFQVLDSAGRGIPNVPVLIWGDEPTDRFSTYLAVDGAVRTVDRPLRLLTDSSGVVRVRVSCAYGLGDGFEALCREARMGLRRVYCPLPVFYDDLVPRDGLRVSSPVFENYFVAATWGGGDLAPVVKRLYAQVEGTALYTFETVFCAYSVRWV